MYSWRGQKPDLEPPVLPKIASLLFERGKASTRRLNQVNKFITRKTFCEHHIGWLVGCSVAWLVDCLAGWLLGCLVAWLLGCLVAWLLRCLPVWLVGRLLGCLVGRLLGWLVAWLLGCLVAWLLGCLVAWLPGCFVACLFGWLVACLVDWLVGLLVGGLVVGWIGRLVDHHLVVPFSAKAAVKRRSGEATPPHLWRHTWRSSETSRGNRTSRLDVRDLCRGHGLLRNP